MKLNNFGYRLLKPILGPLYKLYYNPRVYNAEVIPKEGPIVIAGNHKHIMDQCSVIISTKRVIHYMAKKEYFDDKKVAWFFRFTGCIPVNRQIKDAEAKSTAIEVLNQNGAIGIFPEGTRNKTDEFLLPFKFGAVSLAKKTNATIVPFGISGDYKFRSKNLKVYFGKPFKVDKMTLEEANNKLREEISKAMKK